MIRKPLRPKVNEVVCHKRLEWQHKLGWQEDLLRWVRLRVTQLGYTRTRATTHIPPSRLCLSPASAAVEMWQGTRRHAFMLPSSLLLSCSTSMPPVCLSSFSSRSAYLLSTYLPSHTSLAFPPYSSSCRHCRGSLMFTSSAPPLGFKKW